VHHDPTGWPYLNLGETAERIAAAANATGIGLTLLPVFYAHSNFDGASPTHGQRRFINTVDQFARLMEASRVAIAGLPDPKIGVAPHSLRAATPEELRAVIPLARGGPVHIHAAEQTKEVEDCVAWSGQRPVEWLLAHTNVNERWCLVHATHLAPSETRALAKSRAVAGLCPVTEANLGDGIFPTPDYLAQKGRIGFGTDSNVQIGAAAELRALEYAQRLATRSRNVLAGEDGESTGRTLFERALSGGAQALGEGAGGIGEDAPADLLSLDASDPVFFGRKGDAILDSWLFAAGKVDCVWRGGRRVVERGRHVAREAVAADYRRALQSVLE
jgi:formimidoylglutamate deiminase